MQDSCPTYSGRLRDFNGNISLPPNPEWPSENVRLEVRPIHFLERFSKSFCTSAASFPSISLPTVIHSELALCSFQPFARGTLSVRGNVSFAWQTPRTEGDHRDPAYPHLDFVLMQPPSLSSFFPHLLIWN